MKEKERNHSLCPEKKEQAHPPDVVQLALVRDLAAAGLGDLEDCFFLWFGSFGSNGVRGGGSFLSAVPPSC